MGLWTSERPRNWYDMSHDDQREWERAERRHRDDLEDAERRERDAREEADAAHARADRLRRELRSELSDAFDDRATLQSDLDNISAERDGLIHLVRQFREAAIRDGQIARVASAYVLSKVLVPLSEWERTFWASRRINFRLNREYWREQDVRRG